MSVVHDFAGWPRGPLHVALGIFDGVHLGHQALIHRLVADARGSGATALATTFDPLPAQVLSQDPPQSTLTDAPERAALLLDVGADGVAIFTFDKAFSQQSAEQFIRRLVSAGEVQQVVVGPDFQFGHGREGTVPRLKELGERLGFAVTVVEPIAHGGVVVSSTRIRQALREGDLATAKSLLGRPYSVTGTIVRGERRGRALGFPTINVSPPPDKLLPHDGIYASWVTLDGERHRGAASMGVRPTFGGGPRQLEAFILDFSRDVYGHEATIAFVERLRDELTFESAEALARQIAQDVEQTRRALP